ncbi:MAG TPA: hypothetical protein VGL72_01720 [Bryobacteraceae bacterium]
MTRVIVRPEEIQNLRREYQETGIAHLPGFLSAPVMSLISRRLERGEFFLKDEVARGSGSIFGTTQAMQAFDPLMSLMHFLLNRHDLFALAAVVCDISRPGNFLCRVHRTAASSSQAINWHGDNTGNRMLGLNINLSSEQFSGGEFQLRDPEERRRGIGGHITAGDAFLFRIDQGWEHRLTESRRVSVPWRSAGSGRSPL